MSVNKLTMDQHGTIKETNIEAHMGLKEMHGGIRVAHRRHGSHLETKIKIEEERK
jgi:hypothetical protein